LIAFLENLKKRKALRQAEKNAEEDPSALTWAELAECYMDLGEVKSAYDLAKRGIRKFSESDRLATLYKTIKQTHIQKQMEELKETIANNPTPIAYTRLAEIFKADGNVEESQSLCEEGLKKFSDYGNLYLLMGEIYLARFQEELWEKDLRTAINYLEQTLEYSRHNYRALMTLSETYIDVGAPSKAMEKLKAVRFIAPNDERALELIEKAKQQLESQGGDKMKFTIEPAKPTEKEDMQTSPAPAKQDGEEADVSADTSGDTIEAMLAVFKEIDGLWMGLLIDQNGLMVARVGEGREDLQDDLAGALAANLFRTSAKASTQIDLGRFEDAMIESDQTRMILVAVDDMILALFASLETKVGLLDRYIKKFKNEFSRVG